MGIYREDVSITPFVEGEGQELKWRIVLDVENRRVRISEAPVSEIAAENINDRGMLAVDFEEMARDYLMASQRFKNVIDKHDRGTVKRTVTKSEDGSIRYVNIHDVERDTTENDIIGPTRG